MSTSYRSIELKRAQRGATVYQVSFKSSFLGSLGLLMSEEKATTANEELAKAARQLDGHLMLNLIGVQILGSHFFPVIRRLAADILHYSGKWLIAINVAGGISDVIVLAGLPVFRAPSAAAALDAFWQDAQQDRQSA